MMNWGELAATSHYQTAFAVRQKILARDFEEAAQGIEELIEALSRSDKRALRSQLTRLMAHIIKWRIQPARRSRSWVATITNARIEIASILADEPNQKRNIPLLWDACLDAAQKIARDETGIEPSIGALTEQDVFVVPYTLP